jgi:hypothetical protein
LALSQAAFGQVAESALQQAFFAESHTCSVFAAQQESAAVESALADF